MQKKNFSLTAIIILLLCGIFSSQEAIIPPGDGTEALPYRISLCSR